MESRHSFLYSNALQGIISNILSLDFGPEMLILVLQSPVLPFLSVNLLIQRRCFWVFRRTQYIRKQLDFSKMSGLKNPLRRAEILHFAESQNQGLEEQKRSRIENGTWILSGQYLNDWMGEMCTFWRLKKVKF